MIRIALIVLVFVVLSGMVAAQDKPATAAKAAPEAKTVSPAAVRPTPKAAKSQVADGLRITLVQVKRQKEWADKMMQVHGTAEPGHEFVVFGLRIEVLKPTTDSAITLEGFELEDVDGVWHSNEFKTLYFSSSPWSTEVPFHVSEGLKLKTLRIANVAFDLQQAPARRSK